MPMTPEELLKATSISSVDTKSLYPGFAKFGTVVFIKKTYKVYLFIKNRYGDSKLLELLENIKPSKHTLERLPFLATGYSIYMGENGKLIPKPMRIIIIWKETFQGCLKMSNGNQIASCLMAFAAVGLSMWPSFEHQNHFISIAQILIRLAHSSVVYSVTEVEEILEGIGYLTEGTYGLF